MVNIDEGKSFPKVTTSNSDENIYGPVSYNESPELGVENKDPIIAIDFSPSLYSSISYIEFLTQLDKKNIKPKIDKTYTNKININNEVPSFT